MTQNTIQEQAQLKIQEWKVLTEHFEVQIHLGQIEAKDEFEKQKKNLNKWVETADKELQNIKNLSEEKVIALKTSLNDLKACAVLEKAKTEEAFNEQQQNISNSIQVLRKNIEKTYDSSIDNIGIFKEDVDNKITDISTKIDLLKSQIHNESDEAKEKWELKKKELSNNLDIIKNKIESQKEIDTEKWNEFSSEMSESWKHFKNAIKS